MSENTKLPECVSCGGKLRLTHQDSKCICTFCGAEFNAKYINLLVLCMANLAASEALNTKMLEALKSIYKDAVECASVDFEETIEEIRRTASLSIDQANSEKKEGATE